MTADVEPLTYSIPQAAAALGVDPKTLRRLIWEGKFPAMRIRGRVVVSRKELRRWVDRQSRAGAAK